PGGTSPKGSASSSPRLPERFGATLGERSEMKTTPQGLWRRSHKRGRKRRSERTSRGEPLLELDRILDFLLRHFIPVRDLRNRPRRFYRVRQHLRRYAVPVHDRPAKVAGRIEHDEPLLA